MNNKLSVANDKLIPAWLQPAVILDLIAARDVDVQRVLTETSLFPSDIPFINHYISARHFEQLLVNAENYWPGDDFAFQLGHQLASYGLGPLRNAVNDSISPKEFLILLSQFQFLVGPTLANRLIQSNSGDWYCLFRPAASAQMNSIALHSTMTIISHLLKRIDHSSIEVDYFFTTHTTQVESFHTHLALTCHFNAPFNGLRISSSTLPQPQVQPASTSIVMQAATEQCKRLCEGRQYFVETLGKILFSAADESPNLQYCAQYFGISPATLKRRLREHNLSFQAISDTIRSEQAVIELLINGTSVESVSDQLNFHDSSNFRRAFKRWTGTTPTLLRTAYKELVSGLS